MLSRALYDIHTWVQNKKDSAASAKALGELFAASTATHWPVCTVCSPSRRAILTPLAIFGLPGYFLKGIEKGLLRKHLTTLQAEIVLIQLRRTSLAFRQATEAEKVEVVEKWKELRACLAKQ